jgi:hypothetical protein
MPTRSLPAASLRPAIRLPAARVLLRVSNYLICRTLSAIGTAISGIESGFLPALRETPNRVPRRRSVGAEQFRNFAAVPRRMAMRSSSLKNPGEVQYDFGSPSTRSAMWLRISCKLKGAIPAHP